MSGVADENLNDDETTDIPEGEDVVEDPAAIAEESEDTVSYEMVDWTGEARQTLDSMLTLEEIPHTWQGATLVVRIADEERVEGLIEEVDQTTDLGLDPNRSRTVYEVGTWPAAFQASLADALGIAEIPFEWNEDGDLVIYSDDEEAVEEIFESMPDPDDPDAIEGDGVDVQNLLTELWQSASTLSKKPNDPQSTLRFVEAAGTLERLSLPFGFDRVVWRELVTEAVALRDALEADEEDEPVADEDVAELASRVARSLRSVV